MSARAYFAFDMLEEAELADGRNDQKRHVAHMRSQMDPTVLCALLFYAKGGYQCTIGEANHCSQETMSVYINEVTTALTHPNILRRYIKFPASHLERDQIKNRFYTLYGFPGVIGSIDGCHFKIFKPKNDVEHLYFCRKNYHSINVQMVCDANCRILAVNPKFGGATHDAFIWENSNIIPTCKHCIGKMNMCGFWVILLITACCVLHNFALHHNVPDPDLDDLGSDDDDDTFVRHDAVVEGGNHLIIGRAMRDQLARRLVERS
ncbi:unnamed protein product [Colias eurytheme]|nr:unnamed protein product [Colias eurytheme]